MVLRQEHMILQIYMVISVVPMRKNTNKYVLKGEKQILLQRQSPVSIRESIYSGRVDIILGSKDKVYL